MNYLDFINQLLLIIINVIDITNYELLSVFINHY